MATRGRKRTKKEGKEPNLKKEEELDDKEDVAVAAVIDQRRATRASKKAKVYYCSYYYSHHHHRHDLFCLPNSQTEALSSPSLARGVGDIDAIPSPVPLSQDKVRAMSDQVGKQVKVGHDDDDDS